MSFSIHVISIGKARDEFSAGVSLYAKRIAPYASLRLEALKSPARGGASPAEAMAEEARLIQSHLAPQAYVAALAEEGDVMSSRQLARWLGARREESRPLALVVGGANGLDPSLKSSCRQTLSLSRFTFPHRLCLLVLLEQIYRAFTILNGRPYHK